MLAVIMIMIMIHLSVLVVKQHVLAKCGLYVQHTAVHPPELLVDLHRDLLCSKRVDSGPEEVDSGSKEVDSGPEEVDSGSMEVE
jgi:hypothetical protein